MFKKIFITLFTFGLTVSSLALPSPLLQEKMRSSQEGDFIVTSQEGHYSLLLVRSVQAHSLILEEVCVPLNQVDPKKINWQEWLLKQAPGHTAWTLYEVDLESAELKEAFSLSKNGWLHLDSSEQLLTKMLSLPFDTIPQQERKKIGALSPGQEETRPLWTPPFFWEGKKAKQSGFDVFKAQFPDDGSQLSFCSIEVYFSKDHSDFPFPCWLEIHSPHYTFKSKPINSGKALNSPSPATLPKRVPQITGSTIREETQWKIPLTCASYFPQIHLFASDTQNKEASAIPLKATFVKNQGSQEAYLEVPIQEIKSLLKEGHSYRWLIIPQGQDSLLIKGNEVFTHPVN